ncbi:MAG TPA: TonB-dependent receptor [Clostridia bacterium]|nr:TonB-dependent receptor [Clostridia bacterium]
MNSFTLGSLSRRNFSLTYQANKRFWLGTLLCVLMLATGLIGAQTNDIVTTTEELKRLSFEELMNQEVTLVSRRPEKWFTSPSAVQVVTGEDIRRSGAWSIPEALRLAPNLQVAQVDTASWAITARGFNRGSPFGSGTGFNFGLANKLQVLIDGRSVYTPLFAGVLWDVQDTLLEDVDRIEVISGPGAVLWGANAVNGVINVVTKSAKDTQGALVTAGGGTLLQDFAGLRYGGTLATNVFFRVYGKYFDRNSTVFPDGTDATNDWRMGQGGFRMDWLPANGDTITLQGDGYLGSTEQPAFSDATANGQNFLARWTHLLTDESDVRVQLYWDRADRDIPGVGAETLNTYDLDFQHRFPIGERHTFLWGGGYRLVADEVPPSPILSFAPSSRNLQLFSAFAQDEITLVPNRLQLTLGSRLEHNDYSGFEFQPNGRLTWTPTDKQTIWGAISRAVRSPSRIDRDLILSVPPVTLLGSEESDSEKLLAYELGYRIRPVSRLLLSVATFYNDYDDIHSIEPSTISPTTLVFGSGLRGESWGVELSGTYQVTDTWRLRGGYTYFDKRLTLKPGSRDVTLGVAEGNDPQNQFLLQSMLDLPWHLELDVIARYVDTLPSPHVPSYFTFDVRVAWSPRRNLELAIIGQNLWDNQHPEFGPALTRQEIPRSVYGKITWRF